MHMSTCTLRGALLSALLCAVAAGSLLLDASGGIVDHSARNAHLRSAILERQGLTIAHAEEVPAPMSFAGYECEFRRPVPAPHASEDAVVRPPTMEESLSALGSGCVTCVLPLAVQCNECRVALFGWGDVCACTVRCL